MVSLRRRECDGVGRVERLDARLVVTVEWRGAATRKAELVILRIGEPHPDSVQVDASAPAVDQCRRKGFLDDQAEFGMAVPLAVGAEVADVFSSSERCAGLLQQKD